MVVLDDSGDAGLLEHDLGDPRAIGIIDVAPGELPRMGAVPSDQLSPEERSVECCTSRSSALHSIFVGCYWPV